jgi:hypothetical protein
MTLILNQGTCSANEKSQKKVSLQLSKYGYCSLAKASQPLFSFTGDALS